MTTSYWLAQPREPFPWRSTSGGQVDVVIVGGGVTGCSCALTLAERGLRVRLYEGREIAGGASGRNGGFALRGGPGAYDEARVSMGAEPARLLWELSERALDRLECLAGNAFWRGGSLRLAADKDERDALEREHDALRDDGFAVEWVEPLPVPLGRLCAGALAHPGDGSIDPVRWVRRLAARAAAAGAEIVEGHPIDAAELDSLGAPAVVLAADGLMATLAPELEAYVRPVRGQVLVTEPIPERLYERPHYARGGFDYWQQLPDGRLLVGGKRDLSLETEATAVESTTPFIQRRLDELTIELLGRLPPVSHRWAGIWGETIDRLPLVGRLPGRDGVWVAGGYSGHGNVLGLACGELAARAVMGEDAPQISLFDPSRSWAGGPPLRRPDGAEALPRS
jgi:gamma-glutamylputrescine oxidase